MIAFSDSEKISMGFGCVPENEKEFENKYIPEEIRSSPKYSGYSFVFKYRDIGKKINKLNRL